LPRKWSFARMVHPAKLHKNHSNCPWHNLFTQN
jgi:hypothetical protein